MSNASRRRSRRAVMIGYCYRRQCGRRIVLDSSVTVTLTRYEHAPHMNDFRVVCAGCNHTTRFFLNGLPFFDGQSWLYSNANVIATDRPLPSRKCTKVYLMEFGLGAPVPAAGVDINATVKQFAAAIDPITIIAGLI